MTTSHLSALSSQKITQGCALFWKLGTSDLSCQICIHTVQWDPWLSVQEQLEQWAQKEHAAHPGKWGWICFLKFPFSLRAISDRHTHLLWGHIVSAVHGRKTAVLLPLSSSRYCSLREFYTYPQRCLYVSGKYSCRLQKKKFHMPYKFKSFFT